MASLGNDGITSLYGNSLYAAGHLIALAQFIPYHYGLGCLIEKWCMSSGEIILCPNGSLARYVKLWVAHTPGIPERFPRHRGLAILTYGTCVTYGTSHNGTCVTQVLWCMPGSLTNGFLWSRWRGKRFRHSRRMRSTHFYASGNRSME